MKKSILILVILMASCCLYAQSWPKRTLTKNDSSVYNNVNDTWKVINNNAVVDKYFNKIEKNANS